MEIIITQKKESKTKNNKFGNVSFHLGCNTKNKDPIIELKIKPKIKPINDNNIF